MTSSLSHLALFPALPCSPPTGTHSPKSSAWGMRLVCMHAWACKTRVQYTSLKMTLQFENNFCNCTNTCSSRRTLGGITRKTKQNSWKFCVYSYKVGTHIMGASASSETFCYILWIKLFASKMIKHSETRFPICSKDVLHVHGTPCWNPPTTPYPTFLASAKPIFKTVLKPAHHPLSHFFC